MSGPDDTMELMITASFSVEIIHETLEIILEPDVVEIMELDLNEALGQVPISGIDAGEFH